MNCSGNIKTEPIDVHGIPSSLTMDKLDVNIVKSEPEHEYEMDTDGDAADMSMDYYYYNEQEGLNEGPENVTTTTSTTTTTPRLGKRSRRTSKAKLPEILKFFGNIEKVGDSNGKKGVISATCNACQSRIRGSISVTSNFIKHLRIKHFEIHADFIKSKKIGHSDTSSIYAANISGSGGDAIALTTDLNSFDNRILEYVIDTTAPISTVERNSFRKLFKGTNLKVMTCAILVERLDNRFTRIWDYIKRIVSNQKYLCTTADIWSTANSNFLAYTAHWLNEKYDRHSVALAFRKVSGDPNDGLHILNVINEINCEYNLNSSTIVATITNSGSRNYTNIFRQFGIYCNGIDFKSVEVQSKSLPKQIECASYSLNLLISTDYIEILSKDEVLRERHIEIFKKLGRLWEKCDQPWASKVIVELLGEPLITPNVTKCNSIYDAICSILTHKEQLVELCGQLNLPDILFSTSEVQYLIEYRLLISPIAATIEFLENESNLYYGCLIPALTSLYVKLKRISKESSDVKALKNAAIEFLEVLKKRFAIYFNLTEDANQAIVAAVLCPSLKMRWFNALANICRNGRKADDIHRIVISEAVRYAKLEDIDNSKLMKLEQIISVPKRQASDDFFEFEDIDETSDLDTSLSNLADIANVQLQSYLRDAGTTFEILEKYPLLQDLAIKFNTPLPSSAPVERLFSFSNISSQSSWDQSADYSFERLLLIKANSVLLNKLE